MKNLDTGNYKRIRKDVARRLYNEGKTVYLTPSNVVASNTNPWVKPCPISKSKWGWERDFDRVVNKFEYYNCNYNELGYYANFWLINEKGGMKNEKNQH